MLVGTRAISGLRSGEFLEIFDEYSSHLDHVWNVIFEALARTQSNRSLREFRADCIYPLNFITPGQFRFEDSVLSSLGKYAWSGVTRVQLNLTTSFGAKDRNGVHMAFPTTEEGCLNLSAFAASLHKLEALDLCFDYRTGSGLICQSFLSHTNASQLKSLRLAGLFVDAESLAGIMARLEKVRELGLESTNLVEGSWLTVLQEISQLPGLDRLDLRHLRQSGRACSFPKQLKRERADTDETVPRKRAEFFQPDGEVASDSDASRASSDEVFGGLRHGRAEYDRHAEHDGQTETSQYIDTDDSSIDWISDSASYMSDDSINGMSNASSADDPANTAYTSSTVSDDETFETQVDIDFLFDVVNTGRTGEGTDHVSLRAVRGQNERMICLKSPDIHARLETLIKCSYSLDEADATPEVYRAFLVHDVVNRRVHRISGFDITPVDVFRTVVRSIESP